MIGRFGFQSFIETSVSSSKITNDGSPSIRWSTRVRALRQCFSGMMLNPSVSSEIHQRLIIRTAANMYFFVVCFAFSLYVSVSNPHFFKSISVYDSLAKERSVPTRNDTVVNLVYNVNKFFNTFVLRDEKYISLHEKADELLQRVNFCVNLQNELVNDVCRQLAEVTSS